jgi:hypothetical protein
MIDRQYFDTVTWHIDGGVRKVSWSGRVHRVEIVNGMRSGGQLKPALPPAFIRCWSRLARKVALCTSDS